MEDIFLHIFYYELQNKIQSILLVIINYKTKCSGRPWWKKLAQAAEIYVQSNLYYGVTQGKDKKWPLKTSDPLIQVQLNCILVQGTHEMWLLRTGDPLMEVTTYAGLTVLPICDLPMTSMKIKKSRN